MMWPYMAEKVAKLVATANQAGLAVGLHCGWRSFEEQERLYALGRTVPNPDGKTADCPMGRIVTKARGDETWHYWGCAADIVFKDSSGTWSWSEKCPWRQLGLLGMELGLTWGGTWEAFPDRPHFQITGGLKIKEAKTIGDREKVWNEIAKRLALQVDS